jgi:tetratricopeptide (TPR) repeat protein
LLHSKLVDPKSPVIEPSTAWSREIFGKFKLELSQRKKVSATDRLKQAANKVSVASALYERGADVGDPQRFRIDDDDQQSAKYLCDLRRQSPQWGGKIAAPPAVRAALRGPVTGVHAEAERKLVRLAIVAKAEELWETGRTIRWQEANPPSPNRVEINESCRTKVSSIFQSQYRDFASRYACPSGTSVNDQKVGLSKARRLAKNTSRHFFLAVEDGEASADQRTSQQHKRSRARVNSLLHRSVLPDTARSRPRDRSGLDKEFGFDADCWELLRRFRKMADKDIWPTAGASSNQSETAYDGIKKLTSGMSVSRAMSSSSLPFDSEQENDDIPLIAEDLSAGKHKLKRAHSAKSVISMAAESVASKSPTSSQLFSLNPNFSAVNRGKKKRFEMVFQSLKDKAAKAAKAAVLAMHLTQESTKLHEKLNDVVKVLDDDGEIGTRTVGASWLETELSRRHLLEAAVLQRSKLVFPCGLREAKAMPTLQLSQCCPQILSYEDLIKQLNVEDGVADAATANLKLVSWEESYSRGWRVLTKTTNHAGCSDGAKVQLQSSPHENSRLPFGHQVIYVHEKKNLVQITEPFDLVNRRQRKKLRCELREDLDAYLECKRQGKLWRANNHDVLVDPCNGFLFYDRMRDTYSFSLDRDAVSGSRSIVHIYDTQRVLEEAAKFEKSLVIKKAERVPTNSLNLSKSIFACSPKDDKLDTPVNENFSLLAQKKNSSLNRNRKWAYSHLASATKEKRDFRQDRVHPRTTANVWFSIFHPVLLASTNDVVAAAISPESRTLPQPMPSDQLHVSSTCNSSVVHTPYNTVGVDSNAAVVPKIRIGPSSGSPEEATVDYSYMIPTLPGTMDVLQSPTLRDIFAVGKEGVSKEPTCLPTDTSNELSSTFLTAADPLSPEHPRLPDSEKKAVTFNANIGVTMQSVSAPDKARVEFQTPAPMLGTLYPGTFQAAAKFSPISSSPSKRVNAGLSPKSLSRSMSRSSSKTRLMNTSINDLEGALEQVTKSGRDEMISEEFERSVGALVYERTFTKESYEEYRCLLVAVSTAPVSVGPLLDLSLWFAQRNLGRQTLVCLMRVLELVCTRTASSSDFALLKLIVAKLSLRHFKQFAKPMSIVEILNGCPENAIILGHGGFCLRQLVCERDAERVYTGALLLDPHNLTALRGMAHVYARRGNFTTAIRYLNRINPAEVCYPITRTEIGAILEMQGADVEAIVVAYKLILGLCRHDKATSTAFHCLGHIHHVRGDESRALDYYTRAIRVCPSNGTALLLSACLGIQQVEPEQAEENNHGSVAHIDALFRRGLVFYPQSSWIGLVAYADFVTCSIGDFHRAELILWDAVKLGYTRVIWPVVALAHFYQYTMGRAKSALQLLRWCIRRRKVFFNRNSYPEDDWELDFGTDETADSDSEGDLMVSGSGLENITQDGQNAALCVALAYVYCDLELDTQAENCVRCALLCDPTSGAAHRCAGLLVYKTTPLADRHVMSALPKLKHSVSTMPQNPYSLQCYSMMLAVECKYEDALRYMHQAVEVGGNCPLAWKGLGILTYLFASDAQRKFDSIIFLTKSCEVSTIQCPETWRLKGQILMEMGKLLPARLCLQTSLSIQPRDPITIASLALVVSALGGAVGIATHQRTDSAGHDSDMINARAVESLLKPALASDIKEPVADKRTGKEDIYNGPKASKTVFSKKSSSNSSRKAVQGTSVLAPTVRPTMPATTTSARAGSGGAHKGFSSLASVSSCQDAEILFKAAFAIGLNEIELKNARIQARAEHDLHNVEDAMDPQLLRKLASQNDFLFPLRDGAGDGTIGSHRAMDVNKSPARHVDAVGVHDVFDEVEADIHPVILYWHGMHQLRKGTEGSLRRAHSSFMRAANRTDTVPHALATYMLGWIEEGRGQLENAERLYGHALQLEPFDPLQFLRLSNLVCDTYAFVKQLLNKCQVRLKKLAKKASIAKASQANLVAIFDELAPLGLKVSSFDRFVGNKANRSQSDAASHSLGDVHGGEADDDADSYIGSSEEVEAVCAREDVELMKRRVVMHSRIVSLASIKREQMNKHLKGIQIPAKYVYIDPFWQERLLHAFTKCDDWSFLLKGSKEFNTKANVRK